MPVEVVFPFSRLNAIPGVSGVDDVVLEVLTLRDLQEENQKTRDRVLDTLGDVRRSVEERVDDEHEETRELIRDPTITPDDGGEGITIDVEGIFGPLREDLQEALRRLLVDVDDSLESLEDGQDELASLLSGEGDVDVGDGVDGGPGGDDGAGDDGSGDGGLPGDDVVDGATDFIGGGADTVADAIDEGVPGVDEIADAVSGAVLGALRDLDGFALLESPEDFIDSQLDRLTDGLVSEDAVAELESAIEDLTTLDEDGGTDGAS
jgi:hypothetical protein